MAGLLSGLAGLGLDDLEKLDIFEENKKEKEKEQVEVPKVCEKDLIYDRSFDCPVCDNKFTAKFMKTGKAKLIGTDQDLRAKYEGIDAVKYDVELCPRCGYAALTRYFGNLGSGQIKLIRENISQKVHLHTYGGDEYSYEEAMERYQLCLANAVVKRARASEKAYICLKSAWLLRGYQEQLISTGDEDDAKLTELKEKENDYLLNAYHGFVEAVKSEGFPMCGMDEMTINYLLAVLSKRFKKYDVASKMLATILTSTSANTRMKDKARELKEQILAELKKK